MNQFSLDFLHIGPQRTATSWLDKLLRHHPQLCFPSDVKETRFFDLYYDKGLDWYIWHFRHRQPDQLCGEIAPTYFDTDGMPERIHAVNPCAKIIISLRDPISRTFSLYRHHIYRGHVQGAFQEAIKSLPHLLNSGKYAEYIPKWIDLFGGNLTFVLFDDIVATPEDVLKNVCAFLGVKEVALPLSGKEKMPVPRFHAAAKLGVKIANMLRGYRLHKVVELGKKMGINKIVLSGGSRELPEFTADEKKWIVQQNEVDTAFLESLLHRDLSKWRQV